MPGEAVSYPPPQYHGHYRPQPPISPGPYQPQSPPPQYHAPAQQYGYPPQQQHYPQQMVVTHQMVPTSGWATASLVLGIIGLFGGWCLIGIPCVLAVVAGHIGLAQTKTGERGGRGLAVSGLILGYLVVVPAVFFFFTLGGLGIIGSTAPEPSATP
jgi:hypothetical protein